MPLRGNHPQDVIQQSPRDIDRAGRRGRLLALAVLLCLGSAPPLGHAAVFRCEAGDVACLIRGIRVANGLGRFGKPSIIHLEGTYTLTRVHNQHDGPNGLPSITGSLTIQGAGVQSTILERAPDAPPFRLLHIAPTGDLTLEGLNLRGGHIDNGQVVTLGGGGILNNGGRVVLSHSLLSSNSVLGGASSGGGLFNYAGQVIVHASTLAGNSIQLAPQANGGGLATLSGSVTITNSTIAGNQSSGQGVTGGGVAEIASDGDLVEMAIVNSTIAGNTATGHAAFGGGLKTAGGSVTITNSTIAGNQSSGFSAAGGGIAAGGPVSLQNTIVALNDGLIDNQAGLDCVGPVTSLDYNLIGDPTGCTLTLQPHDLTGDPGFLAYTDDGMPGHGHLPLAPTSQAIDAGNATGCLPTDQLGQPRVDGNGDGAVSCDIGAVEFHP
jgi:hypothetical protein